MTLSDPIADMLTRIRNANQARKKTVIIPFSKMKEGVAQVMQKLGYIISYSIEEGEDNRKNILLTLKYIDRKPVISKLIRESKPGGRKYGSPKQNRMNTGYPQYAIRIWSTNEGILPEPEALERNVGGECLCTIW